jgi:hypothetical protein
MGADRGRTTVDGAGLATSQAIQGEASRLIGNHLAELPGPACRVVIEPGIQPKVRADVNVRIPDLVVTCGGRR